MNKPKAKASKAKARKPAAPKAGAGKGGVAKPAARKWKVSDEQEVVRLVEDAIDKGAKTAQEIHRAVMDLPVTVLEKVGLGRTAKQVRKVQDSTIGSLYELVHEINRQVARLARDLLKQRKGAKK